MHRLVIVFLRGAADGLSLVAPVGDAAYHDARPTLALAEGAALDLGVHGLGLHPAARRLAELFADKSVAVVPDAGFDGQTRSHLESQAALESGGVTTGAASRTGWVGRHLAASAGSTPSPFRGVAVGGSSVPFGLWGTGDALGVPEPSALQLGTIWAARGGHGYEVRPSHAAPTRETLLTKWAAGDPQVPLAAVTGVRAAGAVLEQMERSPIAAADPSPFGDGESASVFASASALLDAGVGTEIVEVDLGGWDTHTNEGVQDGTFAGLVSGLDAGIGGLADRHLGRGDGLVIVVMSEFGRRVAENGSGGTDHGRGGVALVVGDAVAGGVKGTWPGLMDLDNGDVRAVNDLRVVPSRDRHARLRVEWSGT